MSGAFNAGGLITGLDTNTIIRQLMPNERQPITRLQQRITTLQTQQSAVRDLRTQLLALRNAWQDLFDRLAKEEPPRPPQVDQHGAAVMNIQG